MGPLLFLLYINDLPLCLTHCKSILYADDTLLYHSARTVADLESKINTDLESVLHWLNNNLLTLNNEKTKFMIFSNKKQSLSNSDVTITVQSKKILRERSIKYLGITLSEDFSWHEHIDNLINMVNQRIGALRRIRDCLDLGTRCVLYTSLILPLFDYADTIWSDKNNTALMKYLQTLENKAANLILDEHPRYSSTTALKRLKWTTLKTRRHNHRCIFIYKCVNGLVDFDFDLTKNVSIHNHNTRRSNDLHLPRVNSNKGKQRPTYQASIDFSNLDQRTKNASTLHSFKAYLSSIRIDR